MPDPNPFIQTDDGSPRLLRISGSQCDESLTATRSFVDEGHLYVLNGDRLVGTFAAGAWSSAVIEQAAS